MPHTWLRWLASAVVLGLALQPELSSAQKEKENPKPSSSSNSQPSSGSSRPQLIPRGNSGGGSSSGSSGQSSSARSQPKPSGSGSGGSVLQPRSQGGSSGGPSLQPRSSGGGSSGPLLQPRSSGGSSGGSSTPRLPLNNPPTNRPSGGELPHTTLRPNTGGNTGATNPPGIGNATPRNVQPGGGFDPGRSNVNPGTGGLPNVGGRNPLGGGNIGRPNLNDPNAGNVLGPNRNLGDVTGRPNVLDPNQGAPGRATEGLRPRDATRTGDRLPLPNFDPNSNAGKLRGRLDATPNVGVGGDPGKDRGPLNQNLGPDRINIGPRRDPTQPVVRAKVDRNGLFGDLQRNPQLNDEFKTLKGARSRDDVDKVFAKIKTDPAFKNTQLAHLDVDRLPGNFDKNVQRGGFNHLVKSNVGANIHLGDQYNLFVHGGDVARQLNLNQALIVNGGWKNRYVGPVYAGYTKAAYSAWYPGPAYYPAYCWTPLWSPWVSWCFWDYCWPIYDPRPWICRPIYYDPCPPIVIYEYPVFQPLPIVVCGTWVDVPPVIVDTGFDLQLLAVRFVDPGHPDQDLGPRYRAWVRNNSPAAVGAPFNVTLVAANSPVLPAANVLQAGVSVPSIDAGEVVPVDIRLPFAVNRMNSTPDGHRIPFSHLHVLVDSHRDLAELNEENNGAALARGDILPVDPAAFSTDVSAAAPGNLVSLAGEGFGPEPGQLIVSISGVPQQAEVYGWYDLGVYFKVPSMNAGGAIDAEVLVVRGDGAASNPVTLTIAPQQQLTEAPLPPLPAP